MFSYSRWLELPLTTRVQLAEAFGIIKTGATEVASNQVVKDGYAVKDLEEKLNQVAMQDFLGAVDGEDSNLFDLVIEKVTYVAPAPTVVQEVVTKTTVTETVTRPVVEPTLSQEQVEKAKETLEVVEEAHGETKKSSKK